ncbi:hypothetical protein IWZ01DRAFT_295706 [Phyllosticta capitalensis]
MVRKTRAAARRQEVQEFDGATSTSEDEPSAQLRKEASHERSPLKSTKPVDLINSVLQLKANTRDDAAESSTSAKPQPRERQRFKREYAQARLRESGLLEAEIEDILEKFPSGADFDANELKEMDRRSAIMLCDKRWGDEWSDALLLENLTTKQKEDAHQVLCSCRRLASKISDWEHAKDLINRCVYFRVLMFVQGLGVGHSSILQPVREDIERAADSTQYDDELPQPDESILAHLHLCKSEYGVLVRWSEKYRKLPPKLRTGRLPRKARESVMRDSEKLGEGPIRTLFFGRTPKRKRGPSAGHQAKTPRAEETAESSSQLDKENETAQAADSSQVPDDNAFEIASSEQIGDDSEERTNGQENQENGKGNESNAKEQQNGRQEEEGVNGDGGGKEKQRRFQEQQDDDEESEDEEENGVDERATSRPVEADKRKESGAKERENRRTRDTEAENASEDSGSSSSDDEPGGDGHGLFGLKENMEAILVRREGMRRVRKCVKENSLEIESQTGKALKSRCARLRQLIKDQFTALSGAEIRASQEVLSKAEAVRAIRKHTSQITEVLDNLDLDHPEKFLLQDIYAFIFPALLRTLYGTITLLDLFFGHQDGSLPSEHARHIANFAAVIVKLGDRVRKSNRSPAANLKLKQPINNHVVAPLRAWHKELLAEIRRAATKEQREADREKDRQRDELAAKRREKEAHRLAKQRERHEDWRRLHLVRMKVEPDPRYMGNLGIVELPQHWDEDVEKEVDNVDANGVTFDRVDAFEHRRAGGASSQQNGGGDAVLTQQQQHMAQEIVGPDWTDVEGMVLMEALDEYSKRDYANPRFAVYSQIIKNHCPPGGNLRRFTVQDITAKARYFKIWLAGLYDWVDRIPTF